MTFHTLVTCGLVYIAAGSLVWLLLEQCGVIGHAFENRRSAQGRPVTLWFGTLATIAAILAWPKFAWIAVKRGRQAWAALKRVVWR